MVARFHEGCLHRRVDGQVEEFIFTEASPAAVASWANQVRQMMVSQEHPGIVRWLVDLRLSGPLPLTEVARHLEALHDVAGVIGEQLRIAYLTDAPDVFENLFFGISRVFGVNTRSKWFNSGMGYERRPEAIAWLMQND